jgi:hypothetical protein
MPPFFLQILAPDSRIIESSSEYDMNKSLFSLSLAFFWRFCLLLPLSMLIALILLGSNMMNSNSPAMVMMVYISLFTSVAGTFYWLKSRQGMVFSTVKEEK